MATEIMDKLVANLKKENTELRGKVSALQTELALVQMERDEWKDKAVEMMHLNTYTMEVMQRKGLEVVK